MRISDFGNSPATNVVWLKDDQLLVIRTDGTLSYHSGQELLCRWRVRLQNILSIMEIPATNILIVESLGGNRNDIPNGIDQIGLRIIEKDSGLVVANVFGLDFRDVLGMPAPKYYEVLFEYLEKEGSILGGELNDLKELFVNYYRHCVLKSRLFRITSDLREMRTRQAILYWNEDSLDYCDLDDNAKNFRTDANSIEKGIEFSKCWFEREIGVFQTRQQNYPPSRLYKLDTRTKEIRAIEFEDRDVNPDCVDVSSLARVIVAAWGTNCGLYRFDGSKIAEILGTEDEGRILHVAITYDGRSIAMGFETGSIKIVRLLGSEAYKPLSD
ncbi:MAG: hypothetical protein JNK57_06505 [Planctomycetaceae bacterium]|nr:hypothetical protein [Planctomycetaceae bacterium]